MRRAQRDDLLRGPEGFAQQPGGVELLEPLGVADVGLLAGHAFGVARIDQEDLEARGLEQVIGADPIVAGAFQRDGGDGMGQQPVAQGFEAAGEARKSAHAAARIAPRRDGRHQFLRAHVDPGRVGMDARVDGVLGGASLVFRSAARFGFLGHGGGFR